MFHNPHFIVTFPFQLQYNFVHITGPSTWRHHNDWCSEGKPKNMAHLVQSKFRGKKWEWKFFTLGDLHNHLLSHLSEGTLRAFWTVQHAVGKTEESFHFFLPQFVTFRFLVEFCWWYSPPSSLEANHHILMRWGWILVLKLWPMLSSAFYRN